MNDGSMAMEAPKGDHQAATSLLSLPDDILRQILIEEPQADGWLAYSRHPRTLQWSQLAARQCLTCRRLLPFMRERLYDSLPQIVPVRPFKFIGGWAAGSLTVERLSSLARTLLQTHETWNAGSMVRSVRLVWEAQSPGQSPEAQAECMRVLLATFSLCPNVSSFTFFFGGFLPPRLADLFRCFPQLDHLSFGNERPNAQGQILAGQSSGEMGKAIGEMLAVVAPTIKNLHLWSNLTQPRYLPDAFPNLERVHAQCDSPSALPILLCQLSERTGSSLRHLTMTGSYTPFHLSKVLVNTGHTLQTIQLSSSSFTPTTDYSVVDFGGCVQLTHFNSSAEWFDTHHWRTLPASLVKVDLAQPVRLQPIDLASDLERPDFLPNLKSLSANWRPYDGVKKRPLREQRERALAACRIRGIKVIYPDQFFRAWDWSESEYSEGGLPV
jgi:hypothetical protein